MRKIFLFLLIIISIQSFGQNPANYQYRNVFERSRGGMFDSALTIPRYSSRPSGVRSGSATHAGLLALDTNNHIPSYYSGGIWRDFQPIRDGLYSGGIVTWDSLLVFTVSAAVYYINGVRYETALTHITLDAANGSNPRIDLIVATASGISKITGTAAASPAEANLPIDNIRLTAIYVNTSATTPTGPVNKIIWDENTEFTGAATSVTVDFDNFADPYHFLKASSAGAVTSSSFITYTGSDFSITPYNTFKFFVKLKASFAAGTRFQITWYKDGVQVSTTLTINSGTYGFLRTSGTYQEITIPVFDFGISTEQVDQVKFSLSGSNGSGFYLDYIQLKGGIQQPTGGLNRFGVSGEDAVATQNRYFNGKNTYFFNIDSIPSFSLTAAQTRFKNIAGSDWLKYLPLTTGLNIDPLSTSIPLTLNNIPYNSGAGMVGLVIDTTVTPHRVYRKTASGGTPTLQQVVDAGNTLDNNSIIIDGFNGGYIHFHQNDDGADMEGGTDHLKLTSTDDGNGVRLDWSLITGGAAKTFKFPNGTSGDTLITYAGARAMLGGGGVSAADLPLRITGGTTVSADTSFAYNPSLTTNQRLQKIIDSLSAVGALQGTINSNDWYQYYLTGTGGNASAAEVYYYFATGTGASIANISTSQIDGWMFGQKLSTGTTNAGLCYYYAAASPGSIYGLTSINTTKRYSWKQNVRFEDLSDGTETYAYYAGFINDVSAFSSVTNGAGIRYTHSDSSGAWICWTKAGGSLTEDAVAFTVTADTDYLWDVTIIGDVAYFYVSTDGGETHTLATTIATNVPTGSSETVTTGVHFKKSNGTTARLVYLEMMAYGKSTN